MVLKLPIKFFLGAKHMKLSPLLLCLILLVSIPSAWAKSKAVELPPIPGEVLQDSSGNQIILEEGRRLVWPTTGSLVLKARDGGTLATIDPRAKAHKESGTEALGLEVEEADLGGSRGSAKYLNGKKDPKGRGLAAGTLSGKSEEVGQTKTLEIQGVKLTTVNYSNGASLAKFQWPSFSEEVYFDKRKSLVYDQQTRQIAPFLYTLKQFGDGSFTRLYSSPAGELNYTYDANDKSYRLVFNNAKGEVLSEISCQETCSVEN
jgi:hypothetical protein